jgi:hypothetical protein
MSQQQQPYPYSQQSGWVEATSLLPSIEQPTDHYAAQQIAPRFYPTPPPAPIPPKKHKLLRNKWFWIAIVVFIVISGIVSTLTNGGNTSNNPAAAPVSTSTTVPAAAKPTVKPTQPPTLDQRIHALVYGAGTVGHITEITRDSQFVTIKENAADNLTNSLIVGGIKMDCFAIQKALWTHVGKQIPEVIINFSMPVQDQYGNQSIGEVASCDLQKSTAQRFNWNNLTHDDAWNDYDNKHIATFLTQ